MKKILTILLCAFALSALPASALMALTPPKTEAYPSDEVGPAFAQKENEFLWLLAVIAVFIVVACVLSQASRSNTETVDDGISSHGRPIGNHARNGNDCVQHSLNLIDDDEEKSNRSSPQENMDYPTPDGRSSFEP